MIRTATTAYEVAVEFIRLGDIRRRFERVGIVPDMAMDQELNDLRYRLDRLLGEHVRTRADWLAVVRKNNDLSTPPTVAGVLGGSS